MLVSIIDRSFHGVVASPFRTVITGALVFLVTAITICYIIPLFHTYSMYVTEIIGTLPSLAVTTIQFIRNFSLGQNRATIGGPSGYNKESLHILYMNTNEPTSSSTEGGEASSRPRAGRGNPEPRPNRMSIQSILNPDPRDPVHPELEKLSREQNQHASMLTGSPD